MTEKLKKKMEGEMTGKRKGGNNISIEATTKLGIGQRGIGVWGRRPRKDYKVVAKSEHIPFKR